MYERHKNEFSIFVQLLSPPLHTGYRGVGEIIILKCISEKKAMDI
jgi:hypothetical protein